MNLIVRNVTITATQAKMLQLAAQLLMEPRMKLRRQF
jgi:hypothetical protein